MTTEYNEDMQQLLLAFLFSSEELFVRTRSINKPYYYDKKFQTTVKYILEYADEFKKLPSAEMVEATTTFKIEEVPAQTLRDHAEWFLKEFEGFCRHKAMEYAIESSIEQMRKGNYSAVEKKVRDALLISLTKELGLDFFKDPVSFIEGMKQRENLRSTGWKTLDEKLYGGFNPGELNIFAGAPGCVTRDTKVKVVKKVSI
jgi:hypothetical protein